VGTLSGTIFAKGRAGQQICPARQFSFPQRSNSSRAAARIFRGKGKLDPVGTGAKYEVAFITLAADLADLQLQEESLCEGGCEGRQACRQGCGGSVAATLTTWGLE
jgi:hypothetical protein